MKTTLLRLSVIVPIYKVEKFLPKCIDSLLNQTYQDIEIILVDDGSPDNCGAICDEYAKKDERLKVFHKENGGLFHAQNYGFEFATGDYIAYVDSDDYVDNKDAFHLLLKEAKATNADIIVGNYQKDINGKLVSTNPHGFHNLTDSTTVDFRFKGFYSVGHLAYTWGKIYKRSFLVEHNLAMKDYIYSLDKLFNVECYLHQPKYRFIQDSVYVYRCNFTSVSHQYKEDFTKIWLRISEEMYYDMQKMKNGKQYLDLVAFNLFFATFFSCKQENQHSGRCKKAVKAELKKYQANDLASKFLKEMAKGKYISPISSIMWKVMIWSFSLGFTLKFYNLLTFGIKILIDWNIDGKLSSIGKRQKRR